MSKIFVLGGTGMLGHRMVRTLAPLFDCWFSSRDPELAGRVATGASQIPDLDVTNWSAVQSALETLQPNVVVNCIGVTTRKVSGNSGVTEVNINSLLPRRLAEWCRETERRLFHISTDCVFNGKRGGYTEDCVPDASDLYGRSKALGEVEGPGIVTLRGSIVGRELRLPGTELFEWCISQRGKSIKGFRGALYSGVTTNYLSQLIARLVQDYPKMSGLYQVAGPVISKFDLLQKLNEKLGLDITIQPDDSYTSDKTLRADKLKSLIGQEAPSWDEMLDQLVAESSEAQRA